MREQYFELSVLGSNEQSLKELAFELGVIAIEELENGFIVRSNDDLELVELGIKSLAKALNIPISTQIQIKNNSDWILSYQN
ncbi:MAG: 50S ribosomal protein L11 methyltransferase, partial [Campylobacter sp.]|nr:50S ribosomal protein L11 methyltransferase [Campylobacter sp.]